VISKDLVKQVVHNIIVVGIKTEKKFSLICSVRCCHNTDLTDRKSALTDTRSKVTPKFHVTFFEDGMPHNLVDRQDI
jgi:hypothetical protein